MKLDRYRKYVRAGVTAFLVLAASMIFYYLLFHQTSVRTAFHNVLNILSPLIAALILAYVISPIINFIEQRIIARLFARHGKTQSVRCKKLVRALLILLTYVSMLFALYGLIATLIPELFSSITNIVSNFSNYANNIQDFATKVLANYPEMQQTADQYISTFSAKLSNWLTNDLMPMLRTFLLNLSGQLVNMVTFFKNILLGAIVAIYMLYNKESYIAKLKKAVYALLGLDHGNAVIRDCQYVNQEFSGFLVGKVIDSIIIGAICYLVTSLIGTPYALLVSVIIGVTNIIPFFGPFLGAIPSAFLILLVSPKQCLYFILFIIALQQFDGNILGPKILGKSTGISSFWVIVAIVVGGGFGGGQTQRSGPRRGENLRVRLNITFEEAAFGCEKEINVGRVEQCPDCKGTGSVRTTQRTPFGVVQTSGACKKCGGRGKIIHQPCPRCGSRGAVRKNQTIKVKIPAGIDDGQTLNLRGKGNAGLDGGPAGDLLITVFVKPHPLFERDGNSVLMEMPVSFAQAALGAEIEVPTIDGRVKLTIPEGTQPGSVFRLRGKGIPYLQSKGGGRGDQFVTITVTVPKNMTAEQKERLRAYADAMNESVSEGRSGIFGSKKKR